MQLIIDSGVVPLVVNLLDSSNETFVKPALLILGSICNGNESQTQEAIDTGCLRSISQHLDPQSPRSDRRVAAWLLSSICAGNKSQIQAVIEAGLLPAIVASISTPEAEVRKEAVLACSNLATMNGTPEQISSLVKAGVLEALCGTLGTSYDVKIITIALECIRSVFESGAALMRLGAHATNIYADRIRSFRGETAIKGFLSHTHAEVQSLAQSILDDHFEVRTSTADMVS